MWLFILRYPCQNAQNNPFSSVSELILFREGKGRYETTNLPHHSSLNTKFCISDLEKNVKEKMGNCGFLGHTHGIRAF